MKAHAACGDDKNLEPLRKVARRFGKGQEKTPKPRTTLSFERVTLDSSRRKPTLHGQPRHIEGPRVRETWYGSARALRIVSTESLRVILRALSGGDRIHVLTRITDLHAAAQSLTLRE